MLTNKRTRYSTNPKIDKYGNKVKCKKHVSKIIKKEEFTAWLILTPMFLWWILACGFPLLFGFLLGFFEWKSVIVAPKFIGLENFIEFFKSIHKNIMANALSWFWFNFFNGVYGIACFAINV